MFSNISVWFDRTLVETFKFPSGITLVTGYRLACRLQASMQAIG